MRCKLTLWGLIIGLCCACAAHAQAPASSGIAPALRGGATSPASSAETPRDFALELSLIGHIGGQLNKHEADGEVFGGTALARTGLLEGGVQLSFVPPLLFGTGVMSPALVAGLDWQTDSGLRFDLLGIFGADFYRTTGGLLSHDHGTSATLGFAGARAGIAYRFAPRGTGHVIVGAFGSYEQDFQRVTHRYSYFNEGWFDSEGEYIDAQHTFGDRRLTIALTLGLLFDLMPR